MQVGQARRRGGVCTYVRLCVPCVWPVCGWAYFVPRTALVSETGARPTGLPLFHKLTQSQSSGFLTLTKPPPDLPLSQPCLSSHCLSSSSSPCATSLPGHRPWLPLLENELLAHLKQWFPTAHLTSQGADLNLTPSGFLLLVGHTGVGGGAEVGDEIL